MTPGLPDWLRPVEAAARGITVHDLTRLMPPDEPDVRRGAVLMLFGEGEHGPDLLLTERNRTMRSHPGQVSFPGGGIDGIAHRIQAAGGTFLLDSPVGGPTAVEVSVPCAS